MRFWGDGPALSEPLVLMFEADSPEAARQAGLRVLAEVPECEFAEITGEGLMIRLAADLQVAANLG